MTLRETTETFLEALKSDAGLGVDAASVQFGQQGEMPALSPFIWMYAEPIQKPLGYSNVEELRRAKFTIFAGASSASQFDSQMTAIEIVERCLVSLLDSFPELIENASYGYDQSYADLAVAFLEFEADYQIGGLD